MSQIKTPKGYGIIYGNKYLYSEFFTYRYLAKRRAEEIYMEYGKKIKGLKTWRAVKKHFGIQIVKCRLEVIENA